LTANALVERDPWRDAPKALIEPDVFVAESLLTNRAGLLFSPRQGPMLQQDVALQFSTGRGAKHLQTTAQYANARHWPALKAMSLRADNYRTVARAIPPLQNFLAAQEARDAVGQVFVRCHATNIPDVASERMDALLALGQQGAALFELLSAGPAQDAFVEANGAEALDDIRSQGAQAWIEARQEIAKLSQSLVSYAMARIQDPHLKAAPQFQQPESLPPPLQAQWAGHQAALAWKHGGCVGGILSGSWKTETAIMGWLTWRNNVMAAVESSVGPHLAAAIGLRAEHA
jgi:hypothetical protein